MKRKRTESGVARTLAPVASGSGISRASSESSGKRIRSGTSSARAPSPSTSGASESHWPSSQFSFVSSESRQKTDKERREALKRAQLEEHLIVARTKRGMATREYQGFLDEWEREYGEVWPGDAE